MMTTKQTESIQLWESVAFGPTGSVSFETFVSFDGGQTWMLVSFSRRNDPWSAIGHQWDTEDAESEGIPYDFDTADPECVTRLHRSNLEWRDLWSSMFEVAGYAAPQGKAFYRQISNA